LQNINPEDEKKMKISNIKIKYNHLPDGNNEVNSVAFSPDGRTLAAGFSDKTVKLLDVSSQKEIAILTGHPGGVFSVAFNPDGTTLAVGCGGQGDVYIWDVATGKNTAKLAGKSYFINSVVFSPDGKTLAASCGHYAKLWDTECWDEFFSFSPYFQVQQLALDGQHLAVAGENDDIKLFAIPDRSQIKNKKLRVKPSFLECSSKVRSVAFSPDGRTLAAGCGDYNIKIFVDFQKTQTLRGHNGRITSLSFSPDGRFLASGGEDGVIKLWDATSWSNFTIQDNWLERIWSVAFSPDGKTLASGSHSLIKLWQLL
jgi:WD40 repeat protein